MRVFRPQQLSGAVFRDATFGRFVEEYLSTASRPLRSRILSSPFATSISFW